MRAEIRLGPPFPKERNQNIIRLTPGKATEISQIVPPGQAVLSFDGIVRITHPHLDIPFNTPAKRGDSGTFPGVRVPQFGGTKLYDIAFSIIFRD